MRHCGLLLTAALLCNPLAALAEEPPIQPATAEARGAIPDAAAQKESRKLIDELFKEEWAAAKTPEAKSAQARKLLQTALDTKNDPAGQYILLEMARELAIQIEDVDTSFQAIEAMGKAFPVDSLALKAKFLLSLAANPKLDLKERFASLVDESIAGDNYDLARKLAVAGRLFNRIIDLRDMEAEYATIAPSFKTLADNPHDAAANLAVGRYYCFTKGDWDKGLPLLTKAQSAVPHLKAALDGEASKPAEAEKQSALADCWWTIADTETGPTRKHIRQRAGLWYREALTSLTGLAKVKAEKRLKESNPSPSAILNIAAQPTKGLVLDLGTGLTMKLTLIPSGKFKMGSPDTEPDRKADEGPPHAVTISKPFYMGVCTVTKAQFATFVADSGYQTDAEKEGWAVTLKNGKWTKTADASWKNPGIDQTDDHPVVCVSHNDATAFCQWLSRKTNRSIHLPTEAQWEYACRAGGTTRFYFGDDDSQVGDFVWHKDNSGGKTHPGGQKKPNDWGLYDMNGNVWQWCSDWYADSYVNAKDTDPKGPATGANRILRGGGWYNNPQCRCALRIWGMPDYRFGDVGFRVVVDTK